MLCLTDGFTLRDPSEILELQKKAMKESSGGTWFLKAKTFLKLISEQELVLIISKLNLIFFSAVR